MASRLYQYSDYLFPEYPINYNTFISSPTFHSTPPGHVAGADSDNFPPIQMFDEKLALFDVVHVPRPVMAPPLVLGNANNGLFPEWTVPTLLELSRKGYSGFLPQQPPAQAADIMYCECSDDSHGDGFYCNRNIVCQLPADHIMATHHHHHHHHIAEEKMVNEEAETILANDQIKIAGIIKYSAEERKEKIVRYLKKRNHRNFNKTIKYECRKTLADKRVRIRGRFAKNNLMQQQQQQQLLHEPTNSGSDEELMIFMAEEDHYKKRRQYYESTDHDDQFVRIMDQDNNNMMMMMKQLQEYGGRDDDDDMDNNINHDQFWYQEALAANFMYHHQQLRTL